MKEPRTCKESIDILQGGTGKMRPCEVCQGKGFTEDEGSAIGRAFLMGAGCQGEEVEKIKADLAALRQRAERAEQKVTSIEQALKASGCSVEWRGRTIHLTRSTMHENDFWTIHNVKIEAERDAIARENAALREAAEKAVKYIDEEICWSAFHEYDDGRGVCLECKERKETIANLDAALRSGAGRKEEK